MESVCRVVHEKHEAMHASAAKPMQGRKAEVRSGVRGGPRRLRHLADGLTHPLHPPRALVLLAHTLDKLRHSLEQHLASDIEPRDSFTPTPSTNPLMRLRLVRILPRRRLVNRTIRHTLAIRNAPALRTPHLRHLVRHNATHIPSPSSPVVSGISSIHVLACAMHALPSVSYHDPIRTSVAGVMRSTSPITSPLVHRGKTSEHKPTSRLVSALVPWPRVTRPKIFAQLSLHCRPR